MISDKKPKTPTPTPAEANVNVRVQVFEDPRPNKEPSVLLALRLIEFQPQREAAEVAIAAANIVPVAAVQGITDEAQVEAIAVLVERLRTHQLTVRRGVPARALEMRQDQADDQCHRAKARQVMLGEAVMLPRFYHDRLLLISGFGLRVVEDPGDPEHDSRLGRFVILELPVLQVLEVLVHLAGLGRVFLEGETLADAPGNRPGVAVFGGQIAPLADEHFGLFTRVPLRLDERHDDLGVRQGREVAIILRFVGEIGQELLRLVLVREHGTDLLIGEIEQKPIDGTERWGVIHDEHLFPDGKTCDRMAEGSGWMFPIFLLFP